MCLVSVVMGIYNEPGQYIFKAVDSIINQSFMDFELIIVLDNPDNRIAKNVVQNLGHKDKRIKVLINEKNIGLANSLVKAIDISKGQYIARMDADDISEPDRIGIELKYLIDHPECDLVCTAVKKIDDQGKIISTRNLIPKSEKILSNSLRYGNPIVHSTVMFRKSAYIKAGGYNDLFAAQDFDLWTRMKKNGAVFHYIPKILVKYRVTEGNTTNSKAIIQGLTANYIIDNRDSCMAFDFKGYENYIFKFCNNEKFSKEYKKYEKAKHLDHLSDSFILLYLAIVNRVIRRKIVKNLYFRIVMKNKKF